MPREFNLDDLVLAVVNGGRPTDTRMSLWAGGLLSLPVDIKMTRVVAHLLLSLPFDIGTCRTNQIDAIVLLTAMQ
jgi:hypothetical protein